MEGVGGGERQKEVSSPLPGPERQCLPVTKVSLCVDSRLSGTFGVGISVPRRRLQTVQNLILSPNSPQWPV